MLCRFRLHAGVGRAFSFNHNKVPICIAEPVATYTQMRLFEELTPRLASFLNQQGCMIVEERRDNSFGNVLIVLKCDSFLIRIVKDRGDILIDVGQREISQWYAVENVVEFLCGVRPVDPAIGLEDYFTQVSNLMRSDLNQRGYLAFEKKKTEAITQRLFP